MESELIRGTWSESMPGETQLLKQLNVGRDTVKAALSLQEQEGILVSQGAGRRRRIVIPETVRSPVLRVRSSFANPTTRRAIFFWMCRSA